MRSGFYNVNLVRAYPLQDQESTELPTHGLVDFGCAMLPRSGYRAGEHSVRLAYVRLVDTTIEFIFECDAPGLLDQQLIFQFSSTAARYSRQFTREQPQLSEGELTDTGTASHPATPADPDICGDDPLWEGFLVIGDSLASWLTTEWNEAPGLWLYRPAEPVYLEPSRVQNLADQAVTRIGIANKERTRATTPEGCRDLCWDFDLADVYVVAPCVEGDLRFEDGYNLEVRQDDSDNALRLEGLVGGGAGQPPEDVPLHGDESPPVNRFTPDGGLLCCEVIRGINGIGGRHYRLREGPGVQVTDLPNLHRIIVNVSLHNLALCPDLDAPEPVECFPPSEDPCECGPADPDEFLCPDGLPPGSTTTPAP